MPFKIDLDYTQFLPDSGTLFDPNRPAGQVNTPNGPVNIASGQEARDAVQAAANTWQAFIQDDFAPVPAGVYFNVTNPKTGFDATPFKLTSNVDDVRIFVGARPLGTDTADTRQGDLTLGSAFSVTGVDYDYLKARRRGLNAEPFVASIAFNDIISPSNVIFFTTQLPTPNIPFLPASPSNPAFFNLYTVALHEIGHVLGFYVDGTSLPPTNPTAFAYGIQGNNFVGIKNLTSGGVPLDNPFTGHFDRSLVSGTVLSTSPYTTNSGQQEPALMGKGILNGSVADSWGITDKDLKFLADVGYQITGTTAIPLTAPTPTPTFNFPGYIIGGTIGDDTIAGNTGDDTLAGGPGNDSINGGVGKDYMYGGDGADTLVGGNGDDTLNDTLIGGLGNDRIDGGLGNDFVVGGLGNDILIGNANDDTLVGDAGNDSLYGGGSRNNLKGFDPTAINPTEVDTLFHSANSINRFLLTDNNLNGYRNGGDLDYADIQLYASAQDVLAVTSTSSIGRVVVGPDTYVYDNSMNPRELIAIVRDITTATDVRLTSAVNPFVTSINRAAANPTNAPTLPFTVVFSEPVTGVDLSDFVLTSTGAITGAITGVSGSGNTYTVDTTTSAGDGTIDIDLIDDDSIIDIDSATLGGLGAGNGNFTGGETYTVVLNLPTPVQLAIATTPSGGNASETDATAITVTATTAAPVIGNQTVSVALTGIATAADFTGTIPTQIAIADGQTTGSFTVNINNDLLIEGTEIATFAISNPSAGLTLGATTSGNVTITDNDFPTVNLSVVPSTGTEEGANLVTVTATASSTVVGNQTVAVNLSGAGILPTDFTGTIPSTITILNGQTTGSFTVNLNDDLLIEGSETAIFTIATPSAGLTLGATTTGNIAITDNDLVGTAGNDILTGTPGFNALSGLAGNDNLSGLAGNDSLNGGDNNDTLNGGLGVDTMIGGLGNDIYVRDNASDVITETSTLATEIDTVQSSVSYALGANLETLTLTGAAVINGTGNALNNTLAGNSAANILNGGIGNDTMVGGLGNDIYVRDSASEVITETSALVTEIDTVQSSLTYTLGTNLENLTLLGAALANGFGNGLNNLLSGNSAANFLDGGIGNDTLNGGLGNDVLIGGAGSDRLTSGSPDDADIFRFTNITDRTDTITDFDRVDNGAIAGDDRDQIQVANTGFNPTGGASDLANGVLPAVRFGDGTAALGTLSGFRYFAATGQLFFDSNGGSHDVGVGSLLLATLTNLPSFASIAGSITLI